MKALVAGFGNIFFQDDAYGSEVARLLLTQPLPDDVHVTDFGIRGMHVAFEMLGGYDLVIFVDAVPRGGAPGTLYVIEPTAASKGDAPDAHAMELDNVLALYELLARDLEPAKRPKIVIIGCEPFSTDDGMGLSDAVSQAVPATLPLIHNVLAQYGIGMQTYEKT